MTLSIILKYDGYVLMGKSGVSPRAFGWTSCKIKGTEQIITWVSDELCRLWVKPKRRNLPKQLGLKHIESIDCAPSNFLLITQGFQEIGAGNYGFPHTCVYTDMRHGDDNNCLLTVATLAYDQNGRAHFKPGEHQLRGFTKLTPT